MSLEVDMNPVALLTSFTATALVLSLVLCAPVFAAQDELTVEALSVVRVKSRAVRDARSATTLGTQREGTGVVIDSNGLVLTIGYLVTEAETVELSTTDGKTFPATVVSSDAR